MLGPALQSSGWREGGPLAWLLRQEEAEVPPFRRPQAWGARGVCWGGLSPEACLPPHQVPQ